MPRGRRAVHLDPQGPADIVVTLRSRVEQLASPRRPESDSARIVIDMPTSASSAARSRTLGDLVASGEVRVGRGARLDLNRLHPDGAVPVFRCEDLLGRRPRPAAGLGAMEVVTECPRAERTEKGDVVFCTTPRPAAVVDHEGGAIVAAPARRLTAVADSVVPQVLAAAMNLMPSTAREWRTWHVPVMSDTSAAGLAAALDILEADRRATTDRLGQLDELAADLLARAAPHGVVVRVAALSESQNVIESVTSEGSESGAW